MSNLLPIIQNKHGADPDYLHKSIIKEKLIFFFTEYVYFISYSTFKSIGLGNKFLQFVNFFCSMFLLNLIFLIDTNITVCIFDLMYLYLI